MSTLQELKQEADDLGVSYAKNVSANKLQEKIEDFYEAKESGSIAESAPVVAEVAPAVSTTEDKRRSREKAARETKVVTIIDNDQRVNNQTTTCTVNCSNEFFDLGTVILPLNEKIEVAKGHIRTLEQVKIPQHVRDNRTGLASVRLRPRYTISYENV